MTRAASFALAIWRDRCVRASAQSTARSTLLQRHGVQVKDGGFEAAFDAHAAPTVPVTPGSFADAAGAADERQRRRADRRGVCLRDPRRAIGPRRVAAGTGGGGAGAGRDDRLRAIAARGSPAPGWRGGCSRRRSIDRPQRPAVPPGMADGAVRAVESGRRDRAAGGDGCARAAARDQRRRLAHRAVPLLSRRQQARARRRRARGAGAHRRSLDDRDRQAARRRPMGRGQGRDRAGGGVRARADVARTDRSP